MIKVLLIGDDLAALQENCRQFLLPWHVHLIRAWSFDEASARQRHSQIDVLVMNMDKADADQLEMIGAFRAQNDMAPIVVVSDSHDPGFAAKAIHSGAQEVIVSATVKPEAMQQVLLTSIERKRLERHQLCHARKDELTGLANRLLLEERFERALARADRQATLVALVAIDLDQPEELTNVHGRHVAARLMPEIGKRLINDIRETDTLARTRDTGFTWLVEGLGLVDDIAALVDRVPGLLAESFRLDGRSIQVTTSVGIAVCPFHGRDFSTLLKMAEAAMLDVATLNGDGLLMPPLPSLAERDIADALA